MIGEFPNRSSPQFSLLIVTPPQYQQALTYFSSKGVNVPALPQVLCDKIDVFQIFTEDFFENTPQKHFFVDGKRNMKETMAVVAQVLSEEFPAETGPKSRVQIFPGKDVLTTIKNAGWVEPGTLAGLMETEQWSQPRNIDVKNRITKWRDEVYTALKDKPFTPITTQNMNYNPEPHGYISQIPPDVILPLSESKERVTSRDPQNYTQYLGHPQLSKEPNYPNYYYRD